MPNRNSIEIDDTHCNAIRNEVGNRLRWNGGKQG